MVGRHFGNGKGVLKERRTIIEREKMPRRTILGHFYLDFLGLFLDFLLFLLDFLGFFWYNERIENKNSSQERKNIMKKISDALAKNLKKLRQERKESQEEVAVELNISRSCLANYELGRRQPDYEMLIAMADYFHVSMDYLTSRSSYRSIELAPEEMEALMQMKSRLDSRGDILDISNLSIECKCALYEYLHHLIQM